MLSCQPDKTPDRPEVRDPPPKEPTGLCPQPPESKEGRARPEVRDPPPKEPTG
ncbi:hypothetical protein [Pyxidicoccus trucidator]|uniref:hypothetical protein n=1 Tax=Pyxidicoccus trucidator TaxID=2709662 RepID=UPI0013DD38A9|nr:hypothetical protein [Pyxidicoccus trucidator]